MSINYFLFPIIILSALCTTTPLTFHCGKHEINYNINMAVKNIDTVNFYEETIYTTTFKDEKSILIFICGGGNMQFDSHRNNSVILSKDIISHEGIVTLYGKNTANDTYWGELRTSYFSVFHINSSESIRLLHEKQFNSIKKQLLD